jgi:putative oxidoreductase
MRAVILIRILVGWVFISEGIQKFLFPQTLGAGRFAKIGIPLPQFAAPAIGFAEIFCGALLILGLFTRWVAIPLLAVIGVAIAKTKVPELFTSGQGVWYMLHDARTDFSMALGLIFLLIVGGGGLSIDGARRGIREYRAGRTGQEIGQRPARGLGSQSDREEEAPHTIAGQPKPGGHGGIAT